MGRQTLRGQLIERTLRSVQDRAHAKPKRPVSGRGQGRQPPKAVARSASLESGRSQVYVSTVAPRRRIRLVTVVGGLRFCRTRLGSQNLRRLDTSNGCQDHTVLPSALAPFVCAPQIAHEVQLALRLPMRARRCRVHRIPPRVRDDRDTPLCGVRTGRAGRADLPDSEAVYFCGQDWTGQITLKSLT